MKKENELPELEKHRKPDGRQTSSVESPAVSVVIPAYNAAGTLPDCLLALDWQTAPLPFEVIVVDDGSTDETAAVAEQLDAHVIRQTHRGRSAARNQGVRAARGGLVLFTDADCAPAPDWLETMAALFADQTVAGCKGVYRTRQQALLPRFVQVEFEAKYRAMALASHIDFVDTYSAAYRKTVLDAEAGGPFDEGILAAEDAELSFRLAQRGRRLVFNPNGIVYHRHAESLGRYLQRKFHFGQWRVEVYRRYPQKLKGDSHTPEVLRAQLALAGLTVAALPCAFFLEGARWLLAASVAGFVLTTIPFCVRAWRTDRAATLIAPAVLWLRALALGLGLVYGLARLAMDRTRVTVPGASGARQ